MVKRVKSNMRTRTGSESRTRSVVATSEAREGETSWEFVTKEERYCSLPVAVGSVLDSKWRPRKKRGVGAVLPGITALWGFEATHARLPGANRADFREFTAGVTKEAERLGLPADLVGAEFIRYGFFCGWEGVMADG